MFEYDGFEYTLEEIQSAAQSAGLSFNDYVKKYNITEKKQEVAKTSGVDQGATTPTEIAPVTDFSLEGGLSGSQEIDDTITPIESIKNAFSNVYKDLGRVADFWTGDSDVADFATAAIFNEALGDDTVEKLQQEYGEDSWLSKGIGFDEIIGKRDAVKQELDKKQTLGLIESFQEGDVADIGAAAVSTVVNALGSVGYYLGTAGTGFFFDYAAENYIDYNERKAERLGISFEEIVKTNQDEAVAPLSIAGAQVALEKVGMGKILKGFGKNISGVGAKVIDVLKVGGSEAATEIGQHVLTKYNQRLAEDGDEMNALSKVFEKDFFTAETLETGLQGFVGGAGARGSGMVATGAMDVIPGKKISISPKVTMAVRTKEESDAIKEAFDNVMKATKIYSKSKDEDVKSAAEQMIAENTDILVDAVGKGRKRAESLSPTEVKRIEEYTKSVESNYNNIARLKQRLDAGEISREEFDMAVDRTKKVYDITTKKIDKTLEIRSKLEKQAKSVREQLETPIYLISSEKQWNSMVPEGSETRQETDENGNITTYYTEGIYMPNSKTILINQQRVEQNKSLGTIPHEVLHRVLRGSMFFQEKEGSLVNKKQALDLVNELESIVNKYDKKGVVRERLESNYTIERGNDGKITGGKIEEYLTAFSEAMIDGDVEVEQSFLQQLKDFILNALRKVGIVNYDFKSGDDLFNFLVDYSKTFAEQDKVSERATNLLEREFATEAKVFNSSKQQELNDRINDLVGERKEDGSYDVTKDQYDNGSIADVYDKLIEGDFLHPLIVSKIQGNTVYGQPIENFIQDVKDKLMKTVMDFDPEKNDSLIGWINSQMGWKKQAVMSEYKKRADEQSIDIQAGEVGAVRELAAEEMEFGESVDLMLAEEERLKSLIRPADIIGDADIVNAEVRSKMELLNLEDLSFKSVPNLIADQVSVWSGIPADKVLDAKKNLSQGQYREAQRAVYRDRKKLMKLLPEAAVVEAASQKLIGTSTWVKKNLLRAFYEKEPTRRTDGAGLWEFKLRKDITEAEFLETFGMDEKGNTLPPKKVDDKDYTPRGHTSQSLKALADTLGKLATNTEIRKILQEQGYDAAKIQDIAQGKNEAMFSRRTHVEKKLERREEMSLDQMENRMAAILSLQDKRYTPAQQIDKATAKNMSLDRKKKWNIIAPTADDFVGLLYRFLGKGKIGEDQMEFFKEQLLKPFGRAFNELNAARQLISTDYKKLNARNKEVVKKLKKDSGYKGFTFEDALRVHLYVKSGSMPHGLAEDTINQLNKIVLKNRDIFKYGVELSSLLRQESYWIEPDGKNWQVDTIKSDINRAIEQVSRKKFLTEWKENKDAIFSENNMNKILATYGENFVRALKDSLYRMESGMSNPERGLTPELNSLLNWFRGSVGVTMFFNTRSAVLQTISFANYINWSDNNIHKAAAAFVDQGQFWSDFSMIFNSDYLKERRGGLKTDVNAADIADALKKSEGMYGGYKAVVSKLLQKGFTLTQIGDSVAISFGGAMFYRNRLKTYLKQGFEQKEAEQKAFLDFQEKSEESQQSARPDKLSMQQTSEIGRIFLAFQNTPMQYARLTSKAVQDLVKGRGDKREHISKIAYYAFAQSIIFASLQQALNLFSLGDEDDTEEEKETEKRKVENVVNNVLDSFIRGLGLRGAYFTSIKNATATFYEQEQKQATGKGRTDHVYTFIDMLNVSPPIGIKARKAYSSYQTYRYNKDAITELGLNIENPMYDVVGGATSVAFNIPLDRAIDKARNISSALDDETELWKRIMFLAGWNRWNLGVESKELERVKKEAKKKKAAAKKAATRRKSTGLNRKLF
jgi:hypothetical protein